MDTPQVLGEDLLVITNQFAGFDKTRERSDTLALDRAGKLVVVELKRDSSGSRQDLQALRYAAYSATLAVDDLADLYTAHQAKAGRSMSNDEALAELEEHVSDGELELLGDDSRPRIVLVAKSFQVEVTATCLWLREAYGLEVSCVQLIPYRVDGRVLLASSVLIRCRRPPSTPSSANASDSTSTTKRWSATGCGGGPGRCCSIRPASAAPLTPTCHRHAACPSARASDSAASC